MASNVNFLILELFEVIIPGILLLFFINLFTKLAELFANKGLGLAFGNSLARVFSSFIALGIFILWNNRVVFYQKLIFQVKTQQGKAVI